MKRLPGTAAIEEKGSAAIIGSWNGDEGCDGQVVRWRSQDAAHDRRGYEAMKFAPHLRHPSRSALQYAGADDGGKRSLML